MNKKIILLTCIFLSLFLSVGSVIACADDSNPIVSAGEAYEGDLITGGYTVTNDGIIKGDLISGSYQTLTVRGSVEGDLIAFAPDINISGDVGGNIRIGGTNINIASKVDRNLMVFSSNLILNEKTEVMRNAYLYGASVKSLGKIHGKTDIFGAKIILGGSYEGDVVIHDMMEENALEVLPGTVINGRLTYMGVSEFSLPDTVSVKDYEFIRIDPVTGNKPDSSFSIMNLIKKLITLLAYYLFILLLYKLFPRFFVRSGDFISAKPLSAAGIGIATLGTLVGGLILLILVFLLTLFIFKISIFAFMGLIFLFFSVATVILADIPVSLWLGSLMLKRSSSIPGKVAFGLIIINLTKLALDILGDIPYAGSFFGVLGFLLNAVIWLLGTGALLKTIFDIFRSANRQAESEEIEPEASF